MIFAKSKATSRGIAPVICSQATTMYWIPRLLYKKLLRISLPKKSHFIELFVSYISSLAFYIRMYMFKTGLGAPAGQNHGKEYSSPLKPTYFDI